MYSIFRPPVPAKESKFYQKFQVWGCGVEGYGDEIDISFTVYCQVRSFTPSSTLKFLKMLQFRSAVLAIRCPKLDLNGW